MHLIVIFDNNSFHTNNWNADHHVKDVQNNLGLNFWWMHNMLITFSMQLPSLRFVFVLAHHYHHRHRSVISAAMLSYFTIVGPYNDYFVASSKNFCKQILYSIISPITLYRSVGVTKYVKTKRVPNEDWRYFFSITGSYSDRSLLHEVILYPKKKSDADRADQQTNGGGTSEIQRRHNRE